jgi:hypothetical protein
VVGVRWRVRDKLNVGGEQFPQPVDVPIPEGVEESLSEFLALPPVGLEPGPARVHVVARPHRELATRRLRAPHRRRDLREAEPEDLPQHENRALERAEPLEQQQSWKAASNAAVNSGWVGCVVQRRATSWRCQRRIVAGATSGPRRRRTGSSRVSAR